MWHKHSRVTPDARALTLIELLLALGITALVIVGIISLGKATEDTFQTNNLATENIQAWQTCLNRIRLALRHCYANEEFPGVFVVPRNVDGVSFPDALVVWVPPGGRPAQPDGRPQLGELVIFTTSEQSPNELREFTLPASQETAPAIDDLPGWRSLVNQVRSNGGYRSILVTERLRSFQIGATKLGALRFYMEVAPSFVAWRNTSLNWEDLTWPQGLFAPNHGQRRVRIRIEVQLAPSVQNKQMDAQFCQVFIGSLSFHYTVRKEKRI